MTEAVNPKRRYASARRSAQAADTRGAVLDAARDLFVREGWQKTTIAAIAREASVSNETVYAVFGNKRAVLEALVVRAIRGQQQETPLLEQPGPRAIAAQTDQRRQLTLFAQDITQVLSRVAPLVAVVRSAAEADDEIENLYRQLHTGRRRNLEFVADALIANGPLRDGMDREKTVETVWRLASPELFLLLRDISGLSPEAYADWLSDTLAAALLA